MKVSRGKSGDHMYLGKRYIHKVELKDSLYLTALRVFVQGTWYNASAMQMLMKRAEPKSRVRQGFGTLSRKLIRNVLRVHGVSGCPNLPRIINS